MNSVFTLLKSSTRTGVRNVYKSARFRRERSAMWREGSNSGPSKKINPFSKVLDRYVHHLDKNPLLTKALTSMCIVGIGDIGCQIVLGDEDTKFDFKRLLIFTFLGGALVGPTLHYWYGFLNRIVPGTGTGPALKRLAVDQTIFAASFIPIFMGSALTLEGKFDEIVPRVSKEWFPALLANWSLWIPGNFITFRFITPKFQVLFANTVALGWNAYLSWSTHREEPAAASVTTAITAVAVPNRDWDNERVQELFNEFDEDQSGKIDSNEFQNLAFGLGVVLDQSEVALVITKIDQDGDGLVDLREFKSWLHGDNDEQKEGNDAPSLQAMLLKAQLNARVAMRELGKGTRKKKKKQQVVHVNVGDLPSVPTQVLRLEIETRLRTKE